MLIGNQHKIVETTLEVAQKQSILDATKKSEGFTQEIEQLVSATRIIQLGIIKIQEDKKAEIERLKLTNKKTDQEILDDISKAELARKTADDDHKLDFESKFVEIHKQDTIERIKAVSPDLISAIQNAYSMGLAEKVAANLPQAAGAFGLLTGEGGLAGLSKLFEGTPIADALKKVGKPLKNA
jgi:hypothetical protein